MLPRISFRHSSKRTRSWSGAKEGFTVSQSSIEKRATNNVCAECSYRLQQSDPSTPGRQERRDRNSARPRQFCSAIESGVPHSAGSAREFARSDEVRRAATGDNASAIGCSPGKRLPVRPLNIVSFRKPKREICGPISLGLPAFLDTRPQTFQRRSNSADGATRCRRSRLQTA